MRESYGVRSIIARGVCLILLVTELCRKQCKGFCTSNCRQRAETARRKCTIFQVFSSNEETDEHPQKNDSASTWPSNTYHRQSGADTDFMPRRELLDYPAAHLSDYNKYSVQDWGMEQQKNPVPEFPDTIDSVADAAFEAISGTLYEKQRLDPHLASNVMARNTMFDYRPIIRGHNSGRLGIEIDGANFLRTDDSEDHSLGIPRGDHYGSNGSAMRRLILVLGGKLSHAPWSYETDGISKVTPSKGPARPVAVYFNTVKQALSASRQLQVLRQQQAETCGRHSHQQLTTSYENITILSIGQDDALPVNMTSKRRRQIGGARNLMKQRLLWNPHAGS